MKLVVVTGLSGAGKTQALHTLEDIGFYCVDNLPPMLIPNMAKLCMEDDPAIQRVALGIDTRSGAFFGHADEALDVPLEAVLQRNLDKLRARYPEGFDSERSIGRTEK